MEFKKIIFEYCDKDSKDYKLIATPLNIYRIIEQDKIVVIYNLKLELTQPVDETQSSFKFIECNIPYYISNGETNKFNCDILLPFFCFHERKYTRNNGTTSLVRINSGCPLIDEKTAKYISNGLLLKNNIIENINLKRKNNEIFNKWLNNNVYGLIKTHKNILIRLLLNTTTRKDLFDIDDRANTHLYSFLTRLNNLINIILSLQTSKLDNLTIDYTKLKPPTDCIKCAHIDQREFCILSNLQLDMETKLSIINKQENTTFTIDTIDEDTLDKYKSYTIFDDIRLKIYEFLIDFKTKLYKHITVESICLEVNNISIHDFNNLDNIQICNIDNILNNNTINNYNKYYLISQHFIYILMTKLNESGSENQESIDFLMDILSFDMGRIKDYYDNIPNTFDDIPNDNDNTDKKNLVIEQLRKWNAKVCKNSDSTSSINIYNKYLKYKKKYLNLKHFN